jgi:hypothetical protein
VYLGGPAGRRAIGGQGEAAAAAEDGIRGDLLETDVRAYDVKPPSEVK